MQLTQPVQTTNLQALLGAWQTDIVNWFVPPQIIANRSDEQLARFFVLTHLFGPLLTVPMAAFLLILDPDPGLEVGLIIGAIFSFVLLPLALKLAKGLFLPAMASFQLLAFCSLFGAYHYGGMTSPFMPWIVVSLLLGFFYQSKNQALVVAFFVVDVLVFLVAVAHNGSFPERIPRSDLVVLGWLSAVAATVYMSWVASYYVRVISMHDEFQAEVARHKALEVELEQVKAATVQMDQKRSVFFTKMSHELRTPLNIVIGYSELLRETFEDAGSNDKIEDVDRIQTAAKHLLSLVTDVIDRAKVEKGEMSLQVTRFTLASVLQDAATNALPVIERNGNRLEVLCESPGEELSSDVTKIRQILINLLSNAGKFTKNGTVTLTASVSRDLAGRWVNVSVRDTGIGIRQENIAKLFQDFAQATSRISGQYGGTGLGLALCQKLCIFLGGRISVTSEFGHGTTFDVSLPAQIADDTLRTKHDTTRKTAN